MSKEESFWANDDIGVFDTRISMEDRLGLERRQRDERPKHKLKEPSPPPRVTNNANWKQDETGRVERRGPRETVREARLVGRTIPGNLAVLVLYVAGQRSNYLREATKRDASSGVAERDELEAAPKPGEARQEDGKEALEPRMRIWHRRQPR